MRPSLLLRPLPAASLALAAVGAFLAVDAAWIPVKAEVAQALLERAWTRVQAGDAAAKPWPWADTWPVAVVEAPRLGKRQVVLAEAGGEAMAFGPAHLAVTPPAGAPGVAVIAAHRDTHFRFLKDLRIGDTIRVTLADGAVTEFEVTGADVVRHDRSGITPDGGPPRLALVTCYPFDAKTRGPLRYVVWAARVRA